MIKIYLAAPLFNEMERARNLKFSNILEANGFRVYLPQRDGGLFYELINNGYTYQEARKHIFNEDIKAVYDSDVILCLLDGRVPDEGMCIELGIAFAKGKICLGYKTDQRGQDKFGDNIILDGTLSNVFSRKEELIAHLMRIEVVQKPIYYNIENKPRILNEEMVYF